MSIARTPFFKGGGVSFPENGLKGGFKILLFKGGYPKGWIIKRVDENKVRVQIPLQINCFLRLRGSIEHVFWTKNGYIKTFSRRDTKKEGSDTVITIRSVKILLVCNTDLFGKLAKIGQYLVSILGKSQYIWKSPNSFFEMCISWL